MENVGSKDTSLNSFITQDFHSPHVSFDKTMRRTPAHQAIRIVYQKLWLGLETLSLHNLTLGTQNLERLCAKLSTLTPQLRSLTLNDTFQYQNVNLGFILSHTPQLRRLKCGCGALVDFAHPHEQLRHLDVRHLGNVESISDIFPNLRILKVSRNIFSQSLQHLTNLKVLQMPYVTTPLPPRLTFLATIYSPEIARAAVAIPGLVELALEFDYVECDFSGLWKIMACKRWKTLRLSNLENLTFEMEERIITDVLAMPRLRKLTIPSCSLTQFLRLLTHPHLRRLCVETINAHPWPLQILEKIEKINLLSFRLLHCSFHHVSLPNPLQKLIQQNQLITRYKNRILMFIMSTTRASLYLPLELWMWIVLKFLCV